VTRGISRHVAHRSSPGARATGTSLHMPLRQRRRAAFRTLGRLARSGRFRARPTTVGVAVNIPRSYMKTMRVYVHPSHTRALVAPQCSERPRPNRSATAMLAGRHAPANSFRSIAARSRRHSKDRGLACAITKPPSHSAIHSALSSRSPASDPYSSNSASKRARVGAAALPASAQETRSMRQCCRDESLACEAFPVYPRSADRVTSYRS
jgi:hypothetical protein